MQAGAVKCEAVADEIGPALCDYSFDCTHFKLFKKDGSEMVYGKYVKLRIKIMLIV